MKKIALMLSAALVATAFVIPATSANANPFAGAAVCNIDLPVFPTTGPVDPADHCEGTAAGIDAANPTACLPTCGFVAEVDSYNETCVPPLPPPLGFANGRITSPPVGRFNWVRVGLTAVLIPPDVAGVAAFVPHPPIGTCAAPGPLNADVVGIALAP